jgi:hypothetical protein
MDTETQGAATAQEQPPMEADERRLRTPTANDLYPQIYADAADQLMFLSRRPVPHA